MHYKKFNFDKDLNYNNGWDEFALKYAKLPKKKGVYMLTKEIMYSIIEQHIVLQPEMKVLDFNCGTGNDFPYFLSKECKITGTDFSKGMLNKACELYKEEIKNNEITLFEGAINELSTSTFEPGSFDLIYSITGGFSYVSQEEMLKALEILGVFLKPGGKLITAHFGRFCISEFLYYMTRGKFKKAIGRKNENIEVSINNELMMLSLRKRKVFERELAGIEMVDIHPLLFFTPPYQTGVHKANKTLKRYENLEKRIINKSNLANFSDQFVVVYSK